MFNRDRWKEILEVLTTNWFRTVLTAFGVFWGILILIILLAAGKGLENGIKADFGDIATNTMFMWTRSTTKAHAGLPKGREFEFKIQDVQTIRDNVPNLRFISPRNQLVVSTSSISFQRSLLNIVFIIRLLRPQSYGSSLLARQERILQ